MVKNLSLLKKEAVDKLDDEPSNIINNNNIGEIPVPKWSGQADTSNHFTKFKI